jgi:membrane-associated protease RseP (regulator of RpoE activity)
LGLGDEGVLVDRVSDDSPADKAGIEEHDLILSVGEHKVQTASDLVKALIASEGKEIEVKLLRAAKPMTVKVTPTAEQLRFTGLGIPSEEVEVEIRKLESKIREKLKDAGVDVRMQLIRPGHFVPKWTFEADGPADFPEDLQVVVRKHGKEPAEIEVKRGDKSWTVKENELDKLPEDVRKHIEPYLGRVPATARFAVALPTGKKFNVPVPAVPPVAGERDGIIERRDIQTRERSRGSLERRIDELSRDMEKMAKQMEALRESLREGDKRDEKE